MRRTIAIIASAIAAIALTCSTADAHWRGHHRVSKKVKEVEVGASIVSTVVYGSLIDWSWDKRSSGYRWGAFGATTLGCVILSPMIAQALTPKRSLTNREVGVLVGSCVIPIIGGWLVNKGFDDHPQWETIGIAEKHGRWRHHHHHHKM